MDNPVADSAAPAAAKAERDMKTAAAVVAAATRPASAGLEINVCGLKPLQRFADEEKDKKSPVTTPRTAVNERLLNSPRSPSDPSSPTTGAQTSPLGFSPTRHIASRWRIRGGRRQESDPLLQGDYFDDAGSDTLYVDEEVIVSDVKRRSRRWLICCTVFGITLLGILLILNVLLLFSTRALERDDDPDSIFGNWGRPGTGTEGLAWYPTDFLRDVQPIPCHSHNDYWRRVPLFSALHAGCVGVEADVWLLAGPGGDDLLVGHERAALQPNRTFRSLYINPLVDILKRQNPSHQFYNESRRGVFDVDPSQTLALLVDLKTDGAATWRKVVEQLEPLRSRGWLSRFDNGNVTYGPVTVVGTGNTPFGVLMENSTYRDYFFDAPLEKLEDSPFNSTNSYYTSAPFGRSIGSAWFGGLQPGQRRKLREQLAAAHKRGLKARYWDTPAWPIHVRNGVWANLVKAGVDLLNVDDLRSASRKDWTKVWPF